MCVAVTEWVACFGGWRYNNVYDYISDGVVVFLERRYIVRTDLGGGGGVHVYRLWKVVLKDKCVVWTETDPP